jgi:hypothetical protein
LLSADHKKTYHFGTCPINCSSISRARSLPLFGCWWIFRPLTKGSHRIPSWVAIMLATAVANSDLCLHRFGRCQSYDSKLSIVSPSKYGIVSVWWFVISLILNMLLWVQCKWSFKAVYLLYKLYFDGIKCTQLMEYSVDSLYTDYWMRNVFNYWSSNIASTKTYNEKTP